MTKYEYVKLKITFLITAFVALFIICLFAFKNFDPMGVKPRLRVESYCLNHGDGLVRMLSNFYVKHGLLVAMMTTTSRLLRRH